MIEGLDHQVFPVPVRTGPIVEVLDKGTRLFVATRKGHPGRSMIEISLTRGTARLKRPKVGDFLVEYPEGRIDILSAEQYAAKVAAGGANVS